MRILIKFAVLALLALMAFQTTVYADDRNDNDHSEQEDRGDDDDDLRRKPKFQTKFFGD